LRSIRMPKPCKGETKQRLIPKILLVKRHSMTL
jgi:hypothetical protein